MERRSMLIMALFSAIVLSRTMAQPPVAVPDGFAGYAGTTGGGNAEPTHVNSASEFKSAVGGDNPKLIVVHGNLAVSGVSIGSNTTIIGADESAELAGGGFRVNGTNYIFQNLTIGPGGTDIMEVMGGTKVFITRCTFHDAGDELLSMRSQADYITISWCKFYFDKTHSHAFAHLIGAGDGDTNNRGKLHVTMHHNWYDKGVRGRVPRVRFGQVHIYNNYWNIESNGYCIGAGVECHIRLENSHFENVNAAWADYGGSKNGEIGWSNIIFEETDEPKFMPNVYPTFELPYSYSLDSVDQVKSNVTKGAGNVIAPISTSVFKQRSAITFPMAASCISYDRSSGLLDIVFKTSHKGNFISIYRIDGRKIRSLYTETQ